MSTPSIGRAQVTTRFVDLVRAPVTPQCPVACPFRETCSSDMQAGQASLLTSGQWDGDPRTCWRWEILAELVKRDLGIEVPATAAALREAMAKVKSGMPADAGDAWEGDLA